MSILSALVLDDELLVELSEKIRRNEAIGFTFKELILVSVTELQSDNSTLLYTHVSFSLKKMTI